MTKPTGNSSGRSLFRWAGSKRKLLPLLVQTSPADFERYFEPFAGSACLFFKLQPRRAVLGDINTDLMNAYEAIREEPQKVYQAIRNYPATARYYYRIRKMNFSDHSLIDRAARFIYLNRYCFNGVFRTNRQGEFNVPRGSRTGRMPNETELLNFSETLRRSALRPVDFETCLKDVGAGDFVYLDPPYALATTRMRGEYGYKSFRNSDFPRLLKCLRRIDAKGAKFLLSFAYSQELLHVSDKWTSRTVRVRRHVAGFRRHRRTVREVLIYNYNVV